VEVRGAGTVVVRDGHVLVIHRPKHDDWGFPKGRLEAGEDEAAAAVRELEEEVGLRARLGERLGETRYPLEDGSPKVVGYFRAEADGDARPLDGVDEVRWVTPAEARELLSYPYDRALLDRL
jgi:8-oxo-dGTP pyrophosphatase MutT (NUDIX family)